MVVCPNGYDAGGNITTRTKNGSPLHTYGYASTGWKDLLTSFDGTSITYDVIGNPNNWRDGMTFTWQAGRQLASLQKGSTGISYTYSSDGTRLTKTVNGVKTSYTWDGAQLVSQTTTGGDTLYFLYHGSSRVGLEYKGNTYYYIYNLQGDVVGLVNSSGTSVVSYTYDAWGNPESTTGSMASTLGAANPFRYRGYYYDTESSLYYVSSRYYDPEVGRFLNADGTVSTGQGLTGTNMFAYCGNNPVCRYDFTGQSFLAAIGIGLLITGIVTLCTSSGSETPSTIDTPDWDCNIVFNEPTMGEPNSKREWYDDDGNLTKERWYGPDGRVTKDRHHTNHGNSKQHPNVPHDHDWGLDTNGNWAPGPGYKTPQEATAHAQIATGLVGAGAAAAAGYAIYLGVKWTIAAILAAPTGGGSLVIAGVTP